MACKCTIIKRRVVRSPVVTLARCAYSKTRTARAAKDLSRIANVVECHQTVVCLVFFKETNLRFHMLLILSPRASRNQLAGFWLLDTGTIYPLHFHQDEVVNEIIIAHDILALIIFLPVAPVVSNAISSIDERS